MNQVRILIVDDDASLRRVLEYTLVEEGLDVETAATAEEALEALSRRPADIVLTDVRMPGMGGMKLLELLKTRDEDLPIVVMTAYATVGAAVEAMKLGACDYLTKPVRSEELILAVRKGLRIGNLVRENRRLRRQTREAFRSDNVVGNSAAISTVYRIARQAADSDATVLLRGETGTGKELLARAIHAESPRAAGPFVVVTCGAIPEGLVASELFGHCRGAFTGASADRVGRFEAAGGGTLLLDEVGDLPHEVQILLLRAIQEREIQRIGENRTRPVDVRLIAATHRDLEQDVQAGRFREDLYYRLGVVPITLPPLRDRREDIPLLVEHFLQRGCARHNRERPDVEPAVHRELLARPWPGNVRELENLVERLLVLCRSDRVTLADLPPPAGRAAPAAGTPPEIFLPERGLRLDLVIRELIRQALTRAGGNQTRAADLLGITRNTLIYRMEKYRIPKGHSP